MRTYELPFDSTGKFYHIDLYRMESEKDVEGLGLQEVLENPKNIVLSEDRSVMETISQLRSVPGMTDAHPKDFERSQPIMTLKDGTIVRIWNDLLGVKHIFLENDRGECEFSGYVGWVHRDGLDRAIDAVIRSNS
jgi:hypothetical protein